MNRRALKMLLGSGRFLCFDVRRPFRDLKAAHPASGTNAAHPASGTNAAHPASGTPGALFAPLFDLAVLNQGVFFKEVEGPTEDDDEAGVTTRIFFPYNDDDVLQGGESALAAPKEIFDVLRKRGAIKPGEELSAHDQKVLDTLSRLPTFDPFLLLSRRRDLEVDRPISGAYFEISEADWAQVRRPVMARISVLVNKANRGAGVDVYHEYVNGGASNQADEAARLMTSAVVDSIWRGEATQGARQLIRSFGLEEAETAKILFAWKGINYYEFQYQAYEERLRRFYRWLGSSDSTPKDRTGMEPSAIERFTYRRDKARKLIRATHAKITGVLIEYNQAFDALIDEDSPGRFQDFLRAAPESFISVGLSLGVLAHTANAWSELTQDGRKPLQKAAVLEPFYDFIIAVNGQDYALEGVG